MRRWHLLLVLGLLAAGAALWFALLRPSHEAVTASQGGGRASLIAPARRRALPHLAGESLIPPPETIDVRRLRGRPAFLDVWASWCVPCREEAPTLARLARRYSGRIGFLGIDIGDDRGDARAFVRRYRIGYPSIFDPKARLATKLRAFGLPTAYLVDARGRIAAVLVGRQPERKLTRLLEALAGEADAGR